MKSKKGKISSKSNKEYRAEAKECIKAYSGRLFAARASVALITNGLDMASKAAGSAIGGLFGKSKSGANTASSIQHVLTDGATKIGLARVYTKVAKKQKFTISSDLFAGIKNRFTYGVRLNFILPFYSLLAFILGAAIGFGIGSGIGYGVGKLADYPAIIDSEGHTMKVWILGGIIGAVILAFLFYSINKFRYALVYYVAQDEKLKVQDAMDTISESKNLLNGYKMKLFGIEFFYWLINTCVLLVGVGAAVGLAFGLKGASQNASIIAASITGVVALIALLVVAYITNGRRQVVKALFYLDLSSLKGNSMVKK